MFSEEFCRMNCEALHALFDSLAGNNSCASRNGNCSQLCLPKPDGRTCRCTAGYKLATDGYTCEGSLYKCFYVYRSPVALRADRVWISRCCSNQRSVTTCISASFNFNFSGVKEFLMYSNRTEILGMSLDLSETKRTKALAPISKITMVTAIDFYSSESCVEPTGCSTGNKRPDSVCVYHCQVFLFVTQKTSSLGNYVQSHLESPRLQNGSAGLGAQDVFSNSRRRCALLAANDPRHVTFAEEDYIYWVDGQERTISRIKRDLTDRQTLVKTIYGVEGLAVDWIAGNLYWTDQVVQTVEVSRLNGSNRYVVVHGDMEKPRSIVVHPAKGSVSSGKNARSTE